jgi:hypothetical protein
VADDRVRTKEAAVRRNDGRGINALGRSTECLRVRQLPPELLTRQNAKRLAELDTLVSQAHGKRERGFIAQQDLGAFPGAAGGGEEKDRRRNHIRTSVNFFTLTRIVILAPRFRRELPHAAEIRAEPVDCGCE